MKVSVCMISFNHEEYIAQAIDSVLSQKTNFEFEIIIGDDGSPDNTASIIADYQRKHSGLIKPISRNKNIGALNNLIDTLSACKGEYIALLEGDDYWTDSLKLQKQVDCLDANRGVAISSHNTLKVFSDGASYLYERDNDYIEKQNGRLFGIEDYIVKAFFHTSSIVFRRSALTGFPFWYKDVFGGDYFLVLFLSMHGKIHFMNESLSVYRINHKSISHYSTRMEILNNYLTHLTLFDKYSDYKYHDYIEDQKFSILFGRFYYFPSYTKKLGFATRNFGKIVKMNQRVISKFGRWKILIPTFFLRSKVNLFSKNQE